MVLYPILLSQSWSTTVPNFMLVSGIAQSGQNLALSRLAITNNAEPVQMPHIVSKLVLQGLIGHIKLTLGSNVVNI